MLKRTIFYYRIYNFLPLFHTQSFKKKAEMTEALKELVAFDFDHTMVDGNSDTHITKLAPDKNIPDHIKQQLHDDPNGWTPYMRSIFKFLHKNNVKPPDILQCISEVPLVSGIKELLQTLHQKENYEIIVLSDANSVFIFHILKINGLLETVNEIFTNPAYFDSEGCLNIEEYHFQDWCLVCARNICKGWILEKYQQKRLKDGVQFKRTSYIGDGSNDICPSLKLNTHDIIFPRKGFRLLKTLEKRCKEVKAAVCPWESGFDILKILVNS